MDKGKYWPVVDVAATGADFGVLSPQSANATIMS